jgi:hypothetical protein
MDLSGGNSAMAMAAAIGAAWAAATAFWMGVGAVIWRLFFEPRIKALEKQISDERKRCDDEIEPLKARITTLEAMTLLQGGAAMVAPVLRPGGYWEFGDKSEETRMIGDHEEGKKE